MDYKQKYLKYKSKYLSLQQIGGRKYTQDELEERNNWNIGFQSIASGSTSRWRFLARYGNEAPFIIYEPTSSVLTTWDNMQFNKQRIFASQILDKFLNKGEVLDNNYDWNYQ